MIGSFAHRIAISAWARYLMLGLAILAGDAVLEMYKEALGM